MSTLTLNAPPQNEVLAKALFRVSVEHYHQMIAANVFGEDDAIELLDGWIIQKMPKSRQHSIANGLVIQLLNQLITEQTHHTESQEPITLTTSEPEPDAVVVRGQLLDYPDPPQAKDVSLAVEVADSSLRRDQSWKKQLYAAAGIPVYWIVNLPERLIEVYSEPAEQRADYRQLRTYAAVEEVPVVIDGVEIGRIPARAFFP